MIDQSKIQNIILSFVISALTSGLISYYVSSEVEKEAALMKSTLEFSEGGAELVFSFGKAITTIKRKSDLNTVKNKIHKAVTTELILVESFKSIFPNDSHNAILEYQSALKNYLSYMKGANSVTDMPNWTQSFDRLILSRKNLVSSLAFSANLKD